MRVLLLDKYPKARAAATHAFLAVASTLPATVWTTAADAAGTHGRRSGEDGVGTCSSAKKLPGLDCGNVIKTVNEFNEAVNDAPFDPSKQDGKCTRGISPAQSNWAQRLDIPPYYAFPVTCGTTFTFGGGGITEQGQVKDTSGNVISGLFAAGEITDGSFFNNYSGGSGLMKGAVFGRLAGTSAAGYAKARRGQIVLAAICITKSAPEGRRG
jgi:hypothetical protein